jgi:single-strand DNA-binding protein
MYQKVIIVGNLGRDVEVRHTQSGKSVANLNVATSSKWGDNERTLWFQVSVWGAQAESCGKYLKKGSKVLVEGHLEEPRVFEHNGEHVASLVMTAQNVKFLSTQREEQINTDGWEKDEDIPF